MEILILSAHPSTCHTASFHKAQTPSVAALSCALNTPLSLELGNLRSLPTPIQSATKKGILKICELGQVILLSNVSLRSFFLSEITVLSAPFWVMISKVLLIKTMYLGPF